jgi:carboxyl-terminal processing protease
MAPQHDNHYRTPLLALGVTLGLVISQLLFLARDRSAERELELLNEVRKLIESEHVTPPQSERLVEGALRGMLAELDTHSRYFDELEAAGLEQETEGVYRGVGISFVPDSRLSRVLFALPGSPAARAGIKVGDRIAALDDQAFEPAQTEFLRAALSNNEGRKVALTLADSEGGERRVAGVELVPEPVLDPSVRHSLLLDAERGLGYLALSSFTRRSGAEFDQAMAALSEHGLKALILDLRGNRGGLLDAAVHIARRFVPSGVIVSTEDRQGLQELLAEPSQALYAGLPVVVLIDGLSASASEVLAGALQDHQVAVLIGQRSYGKGTVQSLRRLTGRVGGIVKLTTALYRTPSGRRIEPLDGDVESGGLAPDLSVELSEAETAALRRFANTLGPGLDDQPAVEQLESELGRALLPRPPDDAQLRAARAELIGR